VVSYPNYLGVLEDYERAKQLAVANDALFVSAPIPWRPAVLKTAGQWGADISWAKAALRTPLAFATVPRLLPAPRNRPTTARSDRGREPWTPTESFIRDEVARA